MPGSEGGCCPLSPSSPSPLSPPPPLPLSHSPTQLSYALKSGTRGEREESGEGAKGEEEEEFRNPQPSSLFTNIAALLWDGAKRRNTKFSKKLHYARHSLIHDENIHRLINICNN